MSKPFEDNLSAPTLGLNFNEVSAQPPPEPRHAGKVIFAQNETPASAATDDENVSVEIVIESGEETAEVAPETQSEIVIESATDTPEPESKVDTPSEPPSPAKQAENTPEPEHDTHVEKEIEVNTIDMVPPEAIPPPAQAPTQQTVEEALENEWVPDDGTSAELVLNDPAEVPTPVNVAMTQTTVDRVMKTLTVSKNATVGHMLRAARESADLSIDEVQLKTNIRKDYIEALENDIPNVLPERVYVIAYIRSLCNSYRLSAEYTQTVIDRFNNVEESTEQPGIKPNNDDYGMGAKLPWITIKAHHIMGAFIFILLAVTGLILFFIFDNDTPNLPPEPNLNKETVAPVGVENPTTSGVTNPPIAPTTQNGEKKFSTSEFNVLYPKYQHIPLNQVPEK